MDNENSIANEVREKYGRDIVALSAYIPYFADRGKKDVQKSYDGQQGESCIPFPVFDSTLLQFVKKARNTALMDRNYPYVYRRYRIRTPKDERKAIERAGIRDVDLLKGILSRYVLEGQRKATRWGEGVEERIYYNVLSKLKELMDFYKSKS
ncbi:MAG: hypothetical protein K5989_06725 [Lachnospiraceae bacterium]|nr:hypothetical protein [Lachnospiraceae bacterium]